jgi:hypothetical protein
MPLSLFPLDITAHYNLLKKSSTVWSTWRFVAECTAYPKLASLPTRFLRLALLARDTLKSHICLGYENISHAPFGSIFALMTLASNILVMIISNISLLPSKQKPMTTIGKATSTVASPSIGIMHSGTWILTCPSMSGSNLSNTRTQHGKSHSTAPILRTLSHMGRTIRHQHCRTTAPYSMPLARNASNKL